MLSAVFAVVLCVVNTAPAPVAGKVTDWFRRPQCTWCAGNRGLEFAVGQNTPVRMPWPGIVTFVGPVGGVPYVVVEIDQVAAGIAPERGGQLVTPLYEVLGGVNGPLVALGEAVNPLQVVGYAHQWFYVGLRLGARAENNYLDPAVFFGLTRPRARLVSPAVARSFVAQGESGSSLSSWLSSSHRPHDGMAGATNKQTTRHCTVSLPVVASARRPVS